MHLEIGREEFVKRHKKELKGVQKKYIEARDSKIRIAEENKKIKEHIKNEYKEGKRVEFEIDLMKADLEIRSEILEEIYNEGDLEFSKRYFEIMSPKLKNEILLGEYKKGNIDFVHKNFGQIDNGSLKEAILEKELKDKNYKFLYANYNYIYNKDVREKIIRVAYKEENVDFLNAHLEDVPKNIKLEAAIKFKNLKLSKEEMAELLKR